MRKGNFDTKVLAEMAIAIALATVLSYIKIFSMPYGGSVTLGSMVPILLIAFRRDVKVGVVTGVIYGFVQMFMDGWFYSPVGMILDYPLAFGVLGLAGLFKKQPIIGVVLTMAGRFVCHFISGVIFFGMYAPEGMSPVLYSALYNGGYMLPEIIISAILIYLLVQRDVLNMNI
ncbi:energy-coupled thiamine transporter ThiT [Candidatus Bathyarchaeota archaeon]|jgi:thiamine transporter|nr:energy-coupled thiamine transporter ThiT [Candidatus Bathyarchaeota archaeon]